MFPYFDSVKLESNSDGSTGVENYESIFRFQYTSRVRRKKVETINTLEQDDHLFAHDQSQGHWKLSLETTIVSSGGYPKVVFGPHFLLAR